MEGWKNERMDGWMDELIEDGLINRKWMAGWIADVWMDRRWVDKR